MKNSDINVRLSLDDSRFNGKVKKAINNMDVFGLTLTGTNRKLRSAARAQRTFGRTLRDSVITLGLAGGAIQTLNTALLGFPRIIIKANAELERMEALLRGLSKATTGGFEAIDQQAKSDMEWLFSQAGNSPFALQSLTDGFVKFRSAGLDPTDGSFKALVDSAAKYGKTSEELKRASIAIQQMAGKSVVSMEELRQQLGEAVPDAIKLMARGLNVEIGRLVEIVSTGTLAALPAIKAMTDQMTIENTGAALVMSETWDGLLNRLKNNMLLLAKQVGGEDGFFSTVKKQLKELVDGFSTSAEAARLAQDIGDLMNNLVLAGIDAANFIVKYRTEIGMMIKVLVSAKAATIAYSLVAGALVPMYQTLRGATIAYNAALAAQTARATMAAAAAKAAWYTNISYAASAQAASAAAYKQAMGMGAMGVAATTAANGVRALALAVWTALGPFGVAVIAMTALYFALDKNKDKAAELSEELKRGLDIGLGITDEEAQAAGAHIKDLEVKLANLQSVEKDLKDKQGMGDYVADLAGRIKKTSELIATLQTQMTEGVAQNKQMSLDKTLRQLGLLTQKEMLTARNEYGAFVESTVKQINDANPERTEEERRSLVQLLTAPELRNLYDKEIKIIQDNNARFKEELSELRALGQDNQLEMQVQLLQNIEAGKTALEEAKKNKAAVRDVVDSITYNGTDSDDLAASRSKAVTHLANMTVRLAGLNARLNDSGQELAKVNQKLESGVFSESADATAAQLRAAAKAYDETIQKIKDRTENQKILLGVERKLVNVESFMAAREAKASNRNPYLAAQSGAEALTVQLRSQLKLLEDSPGGISDKATENFKKYQSILAKIAQVETVTVIDGMRMITDESEKLGDSFLSQDEKAKASFRRMEEYINSFIDKNEDLTASQRNNINEYKEKLSQQVLLQTNAFASLLDTWEKGSYEIDDIFSDLAEGLSSSLTDFLVEGEADMESFLKNILRMIIQSQIQQAMSQQFGGARGAEGILGSVINAGLNFFSGPSAPKTTGGAMGGTNFNFDPTSQAFAKGGVMSSRGKLPLKKYAEGGIATRPQLALFGEGSMNEAYVPLPDGRSIPVSMDVNGTSEQKAPAVTVNVINKSGQQVSAQQESQPRFDGEKYIVDVVLKNLTKPGALRDATRAGN